MGTIRLLDSSGISVIKENFGSSVRFKFVSPFGTVGYLTFDEDGFSTQDNSVENAQYRTVTDGNIVYRSGVRDGTFVIDKELTATGFDGVESLDNGDTGDWLNVSGTA
jgi:hypothetical protein